MNFMLYALATLGVVFILVLLWVVWMTHKANKDLISKPKSFDSFTELTAFIRTVYECKIEHRVILYGFVESIFYNDILLKNGLSTTPHLDVGVVLITHDGSQTINSTCSNLSADLKKGDFVAILPVFHKRQNFWVYVVVAKLNPFYVGSKEGFSVSEQYVD